MATTKTKKPPTQSMDNGYVQTKLEPADMKYLRRIAAGNGRSVSAIVRLIIKATLDGYRREKAKMRKRA